MNFKDGLFLIGLVAFAGWGIYLVLTPVEKLQKRSGTSDGTYGSDSGGDDCGGDGGGCD